MATIVAAAASLLGHPPTAAAGLLVLQIYSGGIAVLTFFFATLYGGRVGAHWSPRLVLLDGAAAAVAVELAAAGATRVPAAASALSYGSFFLLDSLPLAPLLAVYLVAVVRGILGFLGRG